MLNHSSSSSNTTSNVPLGTSDLQSRAISLFPSLFNTADDRPAGGSGSPKGFTAESSLRFSVIPYPERLSEIVELRHLAYTAANKLGPGTVETVETEEADPRNRQATLVIAEDGEQIVASVRLTPPLAGPLFHHNCRFDGPVHGLPPRPEFLESAWACIHPDHQGKGLYWELVAHMVLAAKRLGKKYLVGGTTAHLWPNWRRCGYRNTGTRYTGVLSTTELWVVVLDVEEVLAGHNIAPEFARVLLPLAAAHLEEAR